MATNIHMKNMAVSTEENTDFEDDEEEEEVIRLDLTEKTELKKKRLNLGKKKGSNSDTSCCQVEKCGADLSCAKKYHKRHRVCEVHAKAPIVLFDGSTQRFCQQCSRFHELSEFDDTKRSCRRRLAGHNERRRKTSLDIQMNGEAKPQIDNYHIHPHL